jgi:hypothetical protein
MACPSLTKGLYELIMECRWNGAYRENVYLRPQHAASGTCRRAAVSWDAPLVSYLYKQNLMKSGIQNRHSRLEYNSRTEGILPAPKAVMLSELQSMKLCVQRKRSIKSYPLQSQWARAF